METKNFQYWKIRGKAKINYLKKKKSVKKILYKSGCFT